MIFQMVPMDLPNENPLLTTLNESNLSEKSNQIHHILFGVHGIGSKKDSLQHRESRLKHIINQISKEKESLSQNNVDVKMLDWKSYLIEETSHHIEQITLKNHEKKRKILNTFPADILFYLSENHSLKILLQIVKQANEYYLEIKKKHPSKKLIISFIAHSLGGIIIYDLLKKNFLLSQNDKSISKDLEFLFPVEHVFLIGSPLALFLTTNEEKKIIPLDETGFIKGLYNIFHPHDLIAYRLEPLIEGFEKIKDPKIIPFHKNDGYKRHKEFNYSNWKDFWLCKGEKRNIKDQTKEKRYDFEIQENLLEYWIDLLGVIKGHNSYWKNEDIVYFVLKKINNID